MIFAIAASLIASSNADTPALPKDVPPVVGLAIAVKDGEAIELTIAKVRWSVVGEEKPKEEWPRFEVEITEEIISLPLVYHRATQLAEQAQNRVVDVQGRKLNQGETATRLKEKSAVLVSVSGQMPDAYYLRLTKPDALIILIGHPFSPAHKFLPQPKP